MWQVHAQEMQLAFYTANDADRFTKVDLGMTRCVHQRHEHLPLPQILLTDIIADNCDPASITMLVTKPFEYSADRMMMLLRALLVIDQYPLDDRDKCIELRALHHSIPTVTGRHRKLDHLLDCPSIDSE
ncbi:hypothetical protein BMW22_41435 (plasmid) [Rhizobium leguminosarum]|uniref:Uncharacterized protein n=1 Tax=Rhizobium leguminosarum TaxID=384 RepID=A0A1L3ZQ10_RHILE|nr:hypothetical protein BMW22_41435 [Rhizobium leguminosarum]